MRLPTSRPVLDSASIIHLICGEHEFQVAKRPPNIEAKALDQVSISAGEVFQSKTRLGAWLPLRSARIFDSRRRNALIGPEYKHTRNIRDLGENQSHTRPFFSIGFCQMHS